MAELILPQECHPFVHCRPIGCSTAIEFDGTPFGDEQWDTGLKGFYRVTLHPRIVRGGGIVSGGIKMKSITYIFTGIENFVVDNIVGFLAPCWGAHEDEVVGVVCPNGLDDLFRVTFYARPLDF